MSLLQSLKVLADRIPTIENRLTTEEATKNAIIMPFIEALGYAPFNPLEVVPEFIADIGIKKGEKVDYAILRNGDPIILIECKTYGSKLNKHESQLHRYFHTTPARVAILSNGIQFRIYSDLDARNKMDEHPFIEFDLRHLDGEMVTEVEKLSKSSFDIDLILSSASKLKCNRKIKDLLASKFESPSDDFVRIFVSRLHDGHATQSVIGRYRGMLQEAINEYFAQQVETRLKDALTKNRSPEESLESGESVPEGDTNATDGIETTLEEIEGFYIVKAIVHDLVDVSRVVGRDAHSYFAIILDDNNRKPICRLWFNGRNKFLGIFDDSKNEARIRLERPEDLFEQSEGIRSSLEHALAI